MSPLEQEYFCPKCKDTGEFYKHTGMGDRGVGPYICKCTLYRKPTNKPDRSGDPLNWNQPEAPWWEGNEK